MPPTPTIPIDPTTSIAPHLAAAVAGARALVDAMRIVEEKAKLAVAAATEELSERTEQVHDLQQRARQLSERNRALEAELAAVLSENETMRESVRAILEREAPARRSQIVRSR